MNTLSLTRMTTTALDLLDVAGDTHADRPTRERAATVFAETHGISPVLAYESLVNAACRFFEV